VSPDAGFVLKNKINYLNIYQTLKACFKQAFFYGCDPTPVLP
jgi:hypothetical protein